MASWPLSEVSLAALTDAERVVSRLAMAGHSNQGIAERRGVSVRTVANQLAAIYSKLDIGSRAELAARLAGRAD